MSSSPGSTSSMASFNPTPITNYSVNFDRKTIVTTVTDKASIANLWASEVLTLYGKNAGTETFVGLGIQWSHGTVVPNTANKTATLQLCIEYRCLIVQLFYLDEIPPQTLKTLLSSPNFTFVGVEVAEDIRKLKDEYGLVCNRNVDLRGMAEGMSIWSFSACPGLNELASVICAIDLPKPKPLSMGNWEARVLSESQVEYGCINAYASYMVGRMLLVFERWSESSWRR
ncbi:PREDICTED: Werner Syndrome-like exonuclease [Nicotiana attenuata]|uniref:Werner Syndrome-like exonuclease n=1 Tax=Nicotiana attenuata TaxID=49451 RepID=UPI000905179F|nr:PREDICTED: Werner Syndrome-like exonuclease [Nicotiana attenuata]